MGKLRWAVFVVLIMLILAGCSGSPDTSPTIQETQSTTTAEGVEESTNTVGVDEQTTTIEEERQNPWKKETVTIAINFNQSVDDPERHKDFLNQSIQFWNGNTSKYSAHQVKFKLTQEHQSADITIEVVPTIAECGEETASASFGYCTDTYSEGDEEDEKTEIRVSSRFDDNRTQVYYRGVFATMLDVEEDENIPGVEYVDYPDLRDPWPEANPVVVNISNQVNDTRNFTPLVEESVSFWVEGEGAKYANYSVNMSVQPDAENADISVQFVDTLGDCGIRPIDTGYVGCAPKYSGNNGADEVSLVDIEGGYTNNSTRQTLIHEFGHVFGRQHAQEPMPEMNATFRAVSLPEPDAVDRERPWKYDRLRVYFDLSSVHSPGVWESEIYDSLNYVESGADGSVPNSISFEVVNDPEKADIKIEASDFNNNTAYITRWRGPDPDNDSAVEQYETQSIMLNSEINSRDVGYYMSRALISSWTEEYPDAVDDNANIRSAP